MRVTTRLPWDIRPCKDRQSPVGKDGPSGAFEPQGGAARPTSEQLSCLSLSLKLLPRTKIEPRGPSSVLLQVSRRPLWLVLESSSRRLLFILSYFAFPCLNVQGVELGPNVHSQVGFSNFCSNMQNIFFLFKVLFFMIFAAYQWIINYASMK